MKALDRAIRADGTEKMRETCAESEEKCLDDPEPYLRCPGPTGDCESTVASVEACLETEVDNLQRNHHVIPGCENLTEEKADEFFSEKTWPTSEKCKSVFDECPDFLN